METDPILEDLDKLPDGSLTQAEVKWLTAEIRRDRETVNRLLDQRGALLAACTAYTSALRRIVPDEEVMDALHYDIERAKHAMTRYEESAGVSEGSDSDGH